MRKSISLVQPNPCISKRAFQTTAGILSRWEVADSFSCSKLSESRYHLFQVSGWLITFTLCIVDR